MTERLVWANGGMGRWELGERAGRACGVWRGRRVGGGRSAEGGLSESADISADMVIARPLVHHSPPSSSQECFCTLLAHTHRVEAEQSEAEHVAFLFGMASHGMADEHFDSLFMERSRCYDPGWGQEDVASLDTASDVLFMAQVGGIAPPEPFLPTEALQTVYARAMPDQPLDVEGMEWGNELLHFAVASVDALRTNDERIATFTELYPWSTERFLDPDTPGSPLTEADAVVAYWLALWERLQGTASFDG